MAKVRSRGLWFFFTLSVLIFIALAVKYIDLEAVYQGSRTHQQPQDDQDARSQPAPRSDQGARPQPPKSDQGVRSQPAPRSDQGVRSHPQKATRVPSGHSRQAAKKQPGCHQATAAKRQHYSKIRLFVSLKKYHLHHVRISWLKLPMIRSSLKIHSKGK